jgi:hypothetical protein
MTVSLSSVQNRIDLEEALDILKCSEPDLMKLITSRKIKAQRVGLKWLIDPSDCYRFKESQSESRYLQNINVLNQKNQLSHSTNRFSVVPKSSPLDRLDPSEIEVRIKVPTQKYEMLNLALGQGAVKRNLFQLLNEKIDDAYAKLSNLDSN